MKKLFFITLFIFPLQLIAQNHLSTIPGEAPGMSGVSGVMFYSKMRPMAMVEYLIHADNGWSIYSNNFITYMKSKMREIQMRYGQYSIIEIFDDEKDFFTYECPCDENKYNEDIKYLLSRGLETDGTQIVKGGFIREGYYKTSDLNDTWILTTERKLNSAGEVYRCKYFILVHP